MRLSRSRRRGWTSAEVAAIGAILVLSTATLAFFNAGVDDRGDITSLQSQVSSLQSTSAAQGTGQTATQTQSSGGAKVVPTTRHITLVAQPATITVATNVTYDAWTFNGTVPGPTVTVNQGDTVIVTFINNFTNLAHSIDTHAAQVSWSEYYQPLGPGKSETFNFTAEDPGIFIYHCGTSPALEHIGNGMYGTFIVNPSTPLPPAPGGTYVLVQSEFYLNAKPGADGNYAGNYTKMLAGTPTYVVFNGESDKYVASPLPVQPNELVRLYVLNVGPNEWSAFHVIGALMNTTYIDGNPANAEYGLQTLNIPPAGGAIVDMYFQDPGGKNPFVTHQFNNVMIGAEGMFVVGTGTTTTTTTTSTSAVLAGASVHVAIPSGSGINETSLGYSPDSITVVIGANNTVVWTNDDSIDHTVTSLSVPAGAAPFDSGILSQYATFTQIFTVPGTYQYHCTLHSWMSGTVIVKG